LFTGEKPLFEARKPLFWRTYFRVTHKRSSDVRKPPGAGDEQEFLHAFGIVPARCEAKAKSDLELMINRSHERPIKRFLYCRDKRTGTRRTLCVEKPIKLVAINDFWI
jgi:hypothetical protein